MQDLIIYGAGSVGKIVEQLVFDLNKTQEKPIFRCIGFIDDDPAKHGEKLLSLPILGDIDILNNHDNIGIVLAFSNSRQRKTAKSRLTKFNKIHFISLIHPKAIISQRVKIGTGTLIYPGVVIDPDVSIGDFSIINKNSTIGHDSQYGDFCTISPGVNLGGFLQVGEGVEFGIGSCTTQSLKIGDWSVIGAGGVVINDIKPHTVNVGVPTNIIKTKKEN